MRILIVDDMAAVREGLRTLLSDGQDVETVDEAGDAEQALRLVNETRPTVVLVDIEMDDALRVIREIKNTPRPPLVLGMSLYSHADLRARARQAGADSLIEKNAALNNIVLAVRIALELPERPNPETHP